MKGPVFFVIFVSFVVPVIFVTFVVEEALWH
jgi:hypothetical protein